MTHCWSLKGQLKVWIQNAMTADVTEIIPFVWWKARS